MRLSSNKKGSSCIYFCDWGLKGLILFKLKQAQLCSSLCHYVISLHSHTRASLDRSWLTGEGKSNIPSGSSAGLLTAKCILQRERERERERERKKEKERVRVSGRGSVIDALHQQSGRNLKCSEREPRDSLSRDTCWCVRHWTLSQSMGNSSRRTRCHLSLMMHRVSN